MASKGALIHVDPKNPHWLQLIAAMVPMHFSKYIISNAIVFRVFSLQMGIQMRITSMQYLEQQPFITKHTSDNFIWRYAFFKFSFEKCRTVLNFELV